MTGPLTIELEMPDDLARFRLPVGVEARLHCLLDRQDRGAALSDAERAEAEGLVDVAELLTLLRLRAERAGGNECGEAATSRATTVPGILSRIPAFHKECTR